MPNTLSVASSHSYRWAKRWGKCTVRFFSSTNIIHINFVISRIMHTVAMRCVYCGGLYAIFHEKYVEQLVLVLVVEKAFVWEERLKSCCMRFKKRARDIHIQRKRQTDRQGESEAVIGVVGLKQLRPIVVVWDRVVCGPRYLYITLSFSVTRSLTLWMSMPTDSI